MRGWRIASDVMDARQGSEDLRLRIWDNRAPVLHAVQVRAAYVLVCVVSVYVCMCVCVVNVVCAPVCVIIRAFRVRP
jgi:hypothetical protein